MGGFSNLTNNTTRHPDGGYGFSDIAVLFRTRAIGKSLLAAFRKAGIPVHFGDATPFLAAYPFHLVADVIKLYFNPGDVIALDSVLTHGFGMDRQKKRAFLERYPEGERFAGLFGPTAAEVFAGQGAAGAVRFVFERLIPDALLDEVGLFQKEIMISLVEEHGSDIRQLLHKLSVDTYTDVARFKSDAVNLLTFHAAKGLEFPVVFIVGAEEGVIPLISSNADIEEERRLFYVALTRAKDKLLITHAARRQLVDKTVDRGGSRFVGEIPVALREKVHIKQPKAAQMRLF
ncbi:3'-5' exonuclease [Parapedobacter koreensis]|uniref:DNA 3'-5' helicase II n=1 Tax=Parapedobacter koreensis TaxID=332977 RepID=A0A1H7U174_9SPHI|nr:ATP-dependent helicase [Parapedobacter koreensis]SEL90852.1 DNA helicase-2 / ATP-dependent DNA helicase PcrA [Parapedobacter koreensis]